MDLFGHRFGMSLFYPANCQRFDRFIQAVYHGEFSPRGHAPNELDLQGFHFWVGVSIQGAHNRNYSTAR